MATITNNTDVSVSIQGDGYKHRLPPRVEGKPRPSITIPDADAEDWSKRTSWSDRGYVGVKMAGEPRKTKKHWTKDVAKVNAESDLDVLEALHATEERPKVKEAIELRMKELMA